MGIDGSDGLVLLVLTAKIVEARSKYLVGRIMHNITKCQESWRCIVLAGAL